MDPCITMKHISTYKLDEGWNKFLNEAPPDDAAVDPDAADDEDTRIRGTIWIRR